MHQHGIGAPDHGTVPRVQQAPISLPRVRIQIVQGVYHGNVSGAEAARDPGRVELRPRDVHDVRTDGIDNPQHSAEPTPPGGRGIQRSALARPHRVRAHARIVHPGRVPLHRDEVRGSAISQHRVRQIRRIQVHAVGSGQEEVEDGGHHEAITSPRARRSAGHRAVCGCLARRLSSTRSAVGRPT